MEAEPEVNVFGGIALNTAVGGLNPVAVEACAKTGGKIVWMPTKSAAADLRRKKEEGGIEVVAADGDLRPEVLDILEIIKAYDLILATGHIAPEESLVLVEKARQMKISKVLITHAAQHHHTQGMTVDQVKQLAGLGAYVEYCAHAMTPLECGMSPQVFADMIREVGPKHCIFSTDFGQAFTPIAPEGFRMSMEVLLEVGMSEKDVSVMVKDNPRKLLGL
jgi:predicted TIM-barrel fold metal-dependent hydrolase